MNQMKSRGFTLIEVIVALAILAVMTVLTAGAIQNAVRTRAKASGIITRESAVRDALRVIERDVNTVFNYRATSPEAADAQQAQTAAQGAIPGAAPGFLGATAPGAAPAPQATPDPNLPQNKKLTQFIGARNRMDFTALSHVRTSVDAVESDQVEVGYYVAPCKTRTREKSVDSSCVWRRESTEIDDDVTKDGDSVVLIEHVESFLLRYLGPGKEDWQESWKTDSNGDDVTKDRFPYAVEVTLKVHDKTDPNAKPVSMTMVAEIRFPNNPPKRTDQQNAQPGAPQSGAAQPTQPAVPGSGGARP